MLFSRSCQYGIQAAVLLSIQSSGKLLRVSDISRELNIPSPYLAKILQTMSKRGILISVKGPNGGFRLSKPPEQITLRDVVNSIDGPDTFSKCIAGFAKCGDDNLCPVHDAWAPIKEKFINDMLSKSIGDLNKIVVNGKAISIADVMFF